MQDTEPTDAQLNRSATFRELLAGFLVAAFGGGIILESLNYQLGTAMRMGPGFFPLGLGLLLVALGLAIMVFDTRAARHEPAALHALFIAWRPLIVLPLSILVFAFCIRRFGLVPATFAAVFLSTFAERAAPLLRSILVAAAITLMALVIFRWGLELRVEAFRW